MTIRSLALTVFLAATAMGAFVWIVQQDPVRRTEETPYPSGSSWARSPRGAALAFEYLKKRGHTVERFTSDSVDRLDPKSVILVLDPPHFSTSVGRADGPPQQNPFRPDEEEFIRRGGRVVLALSGSVPGISFKPTDATWQKTLPVWNGVRDVATGSERGLLDGPWLAGAEVLFQAGDKPSVVRKKLGDGEVIAFASGQIFANEVLTQKDALVLLETLTRGRSQVFFDETTHGVVESPGTLALMSQFGLMPALLVTALLTFLAMWRRAFRYGPVERNSSPSYSDSVDLVASLGGLYRRAITRDQALRLLRAHVTKKAPRLEKPKPQREVFKGLSQTPLTDDAFAHELGDLQEFWRSIEHHAKH